MTTLTPTKPAQKTKVAIITAYPAERQGSFISMNLCLGGGHLHHEKFIFTKPEEVIQRMKSVSIELQCENPNQGHSIHVLFQKGTRKPNGWDSIPESRGVEYLP